MGVEWLNRYVALDKETNYGKEPGIVTGFVIGTAGTGYTNGTYNWSIGTQAVPVHGGYGAAGTLTIAGGAWSSFAITDHGQGYDSLPDINDLTWASAPANGGSDTDAAISITFANGFSKGVTYGEADEESMKQTFELLTRQDMSRQVASKAVTNTQYGEGSVSFAVQPDDFMGKIIHSFLPVTECGAADGGNDTGWMKSITITNAGAGYPTDGSYALSFSGGGTPTEDAEAIATVSGGSVTAVYVINPGKGYSSVPTVDITSLGTNGNSDADASLTAVMADARHHVFNEPVLSTHAYPSYTMRVGREGKEHTFTGMVASKLSISANLNEYVMASVDFVGKNEETPTTLRTDVDFAGLDADALHFADAEVYFEDNATKTVKVQQISFEININRNIDSAYAVGNRSFTRAPPTQTREITGSMEFNEVIYSDIDDYINEPTYPQLTGSQVHKIQPRYGKPAIRIKFASETGDDYIEFYFYNVRFEAPEASVSGRDPNRMSVNWQAYYDASSLGAGKAIQAIMKGSEGVGAVKTTAYDA